MPGIGIGISPHFQQKKSLLSYWSTRFDYFVDATDGSDDNDGVTPDTPWQTIAKINAATFEAGDRIGLRAGRVWRETLIMPSSGTEEAPIVIGKYDTGDDPIIDGTDLIGDFVIAELSPNVDFETGITGWSGGDLSWQEAAIGGRTNVAKITASSTGNRYISAPIGMAGTPHTLSFDVYIPSSNASVGTARIREGAASYTYIGYITPAKDEWVHYELQWSAIANNTTLLIYLTNASTNTNCSVGDIIYLDNISVKPSTSYYEKTAALITPSQVYNDNEVITKAASVVVANNQWYFSGSKLLIRDDAGIPLDISATLRNYALTTNGKSWIDINDINVRLGNYKRFQDNFLESIVSTIAYGIEPTALVSPDGGRLDVWIGGPLGHTYYLYSDDGISFSTPQLCISEETLHRHIMLVGSTYYYYAGNSTQKKLFTSTDKVNFTDQGVVLSIGSGGSWDSVRLGNLFVWKEGDNWFMLYEANNGSGYKIGLATSSDGVTWSKYASNPVINTGGAGNPELPRVNNEVIKYDNKYYLYYHVQPGAAQGIYRAYSTDLITWTSEGKILDNRSIHGSPYTTFGDHCLCQFKGKSYILWTPSDQNLTFHIDCGIDNRTLAEILALTP